MADQKIIMAHAKFIKGSPRKLRWVAKALKGLTPLEAISRLKVMPEHASRTLLLVLQQAMGNAQNNFKLSPEGLRIKTIQIGEGPRFKRQDAHAHGARYGSGIRHKKLAHVSVELVYGS